MDNSWLIRMLTCLAIVTVAFEACGVNEMGLTPTAGSTAISFRRAAPSEGITPVAPTATTERGSTPTQLFTPTRVEALTTSPAPCLESVAAPTPTAFKPLRVAYSDGQHLWLWKEEVGTAVPFPLPEDARQPRMSTDHHLIAFRRILNEKESEIWVINSAGENARKLVTTSTAETFKRYPDATKVTLYYNWVEKTHNLEYSFHPSFDAIGEPPLETIHMVDADTGKSRVVIPPGEVNAFTYAPDASQIAALTARELRLIDTRDGRVQFTLPLPLYNRHDQSLAYSVDGRYLVVFTTEGITIVNPHNGSQHDIRLTYKPIGLGDYSSTPAIMWLGNTYKFYTLIANVENVFDVNATFTVWQINVAEAAAQPINNFTGFILSASLSPDLKYLAFYTQQENDRELYLANVVSDKQILYDSGGLIEFVNWNPGSIDFVYRAHGQTQLGHICREPKPLDNLRAGEGPEWVDAVRFLVLEGREQDRPWQLLLKWVSGEMLLIADVETPDYPYYQYYFE